MKYNFPTVRLTYSHDVPYAERPILNTSRCSYKQAFQLFDSERISHIEFMHAIFLDHSSAVLGAMMLSQGGIHSGIVDIRVLAQGALLANATGVIVTHNHPSGRLEPSEEDKRVTKWLKRGLKTLEIRLIDHIIVSHEQGKYYSFSEEGQL